MRAHVEQRFATRDLDVYVYDQAGEQTWLWRWNGEVWERVEIEGGALPEQPSLQLPAAVLEAIIRAAEGHVHPQDATVRHLDDAVKVRDRLLALVEKRTY